MRLRPELKGQRSRTGNASIIETGASQMLANAKLADTVDRVKPDRPRQRETSVVESTPRHLRRWAEATPFGDLNCFNRPVRTRMPGDVGGEQPIMGAPYPDVRLACAHSWTCKSSRVLVTVSEVKRNCIGTTECGRGAADIGCPLCRLVRAAR